ncbi:hypothetical protein [uncultured Cohaesibacter sp.]|uniref:hypothetical protein n=1 Tax=uncultured Cohaesibacter sp. TaxID=1002546 RepID=UPI0029C73098|nr:hypothetical protein [uncultured Cohaesibacter sp.]
MSMPKGQFVPFAFILSAVLVSGLAFGLVAGGAVTPAQAQGPLAWSHYAVTRFGTEADIPSSFIAQDAPDAGDGRTFLSPDGSGEIRIYGSFNVLSDTMKAYQEEQLGYMQSDGFTLKRQQQGENWFVLAGVEGTDVIYLFVKHGKDCGPELMHHMRLKYPSSNMAEWKPIIARTIQSLDGPCP